MTKSYIDYYTRVNFNFNSIPKYLSASEIEDLEQLFISDLIIDGVEVFPFALALDGYVAYFIIVPVKLGRHAQ